MSSFRRQSAALLWAVPMLWSLAAQGAVNDTAVHLPKRYNNSQPPALGGSYTDPAFGTIIRRVSDARNMPGGHAFVSTEYPTASPFNSDASLLILQHQGHFGLYDGVGNYLRDLPLVVNADTEPRWSRSDPNVLFYVSANDLMKLEVYSGTSFLVRSFAEYRAIRGRGESDISRDGDHFVFAAEAREDKLLNRYVFVYEISTDTKGPVLDTIGHPYNSLYIAPDNSVLVGWDPTGTGRFKGVELFDRNMVFQRQLTHANGHMHLTRDTNGDDVLAWNSSNDPAPTIPCNNGIVKVRLRDAHQTCLLQLPWSLAVHITAPDGNGWVFVETYSSVDLPPTVPEWAPYTNEIIQVKLDGTSAVRLFHHRSRPVNDYGYQPRVTVSRDGKRLVYTSNYNLQAILGCPNELTDVYFVFVAAQPAVPAAGKSRRPQGESPGLGVDGPGSARDGEGVDPDP